MDIKTFDGPDTLTDALYQRKKEDVAKMRTSLLACNDDQKSIISSIQNVTVLRIIHQLTRIVQYLDMMDKLEAKMYESVDTILDSMDVEDISTLNVLLNIQERMQRNMIESHKLLQPYLNLEAFSTADLILDADSIIEEDDQLIPKSSRDKLRSQAQQVLTLIEAGA